MPVALAPKPLGWATASGTMTAAVTIPATARPRRGATASGPWTAGVTTPARAGPRHDRAPRARTTGPIATRAHALVAIASPSRTPAASVRPRMPARTAATHRTPPRISSA